MPMPLRGRATALLLCGLAAGAARAQEVKLAPAATERLQALVSVTYVDTPLVRALEAKVVRLSPRLLNQLLGNRARTPYLTEAEVARVTEMIRLKEAQVIATLRTTCQNKQRVYSYGGDQQAYVADYDIAGACFDRSSTT